MTYPNLFAKYKPLRGRDWIKAIPAEELQVFISIGMEENQHGRLGGLALAKKRDMKSLGRIGGIVTSSKRAWQRALVQEMENLGKV